MTHPLRLAIGSHKAGSSRGCAMNVVSWENGDKTITDFPPCTDRFLARRVQALNDSLCTHTTGGLLCPPCSLIVLDIAHRTVGTSIADWPNEDRKRVYVTIAVEEAESVLHVFESRYPKDDRPRKAIEATRTWLAGGPKPTDFDAVAAANAAYAANAVDAANAANAAYAAYAVNAANAVDAAHAASHAVDAAHAVDAVDAAYAAAYAADAAAAHAYADAADAAYAYAASAAASAVKVERVNRIIDRFYQLTGLVEHPVAPEVTEAALAAMLA